MGRAKVCLDKKTEIKALLEAEFSQRYVANKLGVSKTCVLYVTKKLKEKLPLLHSLGQGRRKASTTTDDRNLLRLYKKDRTKSSKELSSELLLSNGKRLSARTIRRRLLDMEYKSYTVKRKPVRKPAQQKAWLSFALEHQYWSQEWNNIIWSDESNFEVLNRKTRIVVRRLPRESNESFNFMPRVQGGGGSVSVWGCMSGGPRGPLVMYSGNINSRAYIQLIEKALSMFIDNTFDSSNKQWQFMHDSAPPHRSAYSIKWFKNHKIPLLKWLATSSDLNPIENLWDYMDKELQKMKPKNVTELQQMVQNIWCDITPMRSQKLVNSMPRRIKQCLKSKGGTFKKY